MVERAAQAHRSRRWDDPITVHNADPAQAERRAELELRQGMGPIEYGPPGRVLSVR
jgi:hypothetical protein